MVAALAVAAVNATVQALDALALRVEGVQDSEESWAGATRLKVLISVTPPALAVTTPL
jgi:hypothetical protein